MIAPVRPNNKRTINLFALASKKLEVRTCPYRNRQLTQARESGDGSLDEGMR
jgi:hypothetical protein